MLMAISMQISMELNRATAEALRVDAVGYQIYGTLHQLQLLLRNPKA